MPRFDKYGQLIPDDDMQVIQPADDTQMREAVSSFAGSPHPAPLSNLIGTAPGRSSINQRLGGVATFNAAIYREIADDTRATGTAMLIVVAGAFPVGLILGLMVSLVQTNTFSLPIIISFLLLYLVASLIVWLIGGAMNALLARALFHGQTHTAEMLRVFGFASVFHLLGIIPLVGLLAWVPLIVGNIIGIREAAEFTTGKAIITGLLSGIISFTILLLLVGVASGVLMILLNAQQ